MTMPADTVPGSLPETELPEGEAAQEPKPDAKELASEDWKAKYEATEAARGKLDNDLKALRGQRMTEAQREERMAAISDDVAEIKQTNAALMKALGSNTTEELPAEVAKIQGQNAQTQAQRRFESQCFALLEDYKAAALDADGNPVLDIATAPELDEARKTLRVAWESGQMNPLERLALLAKATSQVTRATKAAMRTRGAVEAKKVKDEAQAAAKKRMDDAGVLDLDTGREAGGGGVKTKAALLNLKKVTDMSDDDYFKIVGG
jgi:hypothetical protein